MHKSNVIPRWFFFQFSNPTSNFPLPISFSKPYVLPKIVLLKFMSRFNLQVKVDFQHFVNFFHHVIKTLQLSFFAAACATSLKTIMWSLWRFEKMLHPSLYVILSWSVKPEISINRIVLWKQFFEFSFLVFALSPLPCSILISNPYKCQSFQQRISKAVELKYLGKTFSQRLSEVL